MSFFEEAAIGVLNRIAEVWQIEPTRQRWIITTSDEVKGFDWWPGDFCVRLRATAAPPSHKSDNFKLSLHTDFLKGIENTSERFVTMAADLARFSTSCYAWVYPFERRDIRLSSNDLPSKLWLSGSVYVDPNNMTWITDFFANTGIIQPINAQIQSAAMAGFFGEGNPDKSSPEFLQHSQHDEILEVVSQVYAPQGQKPSRFSGTGEFEQFVSQYARSDICFGNGGHDGMTLETPFGQDSALIRFHTNEKHPQLGHGLLATLQLPWFNERLQTAQEIASLNFLEYSEWTEFPQLGCWHSANSRGEQEGVAFTLFIPNALYKPGLITQVAFWFLIRANWVRKQKFPQLVDTTMKNILDRRFGSLPGKPQ